MVAFTFVVRPALLVPLAAALAASCAADAKTSGPTTPFTVWVLDAPLTVDGADSPVAGVPVAFDPAGGGARVTKTTEADGHVTFDGDFSQGPASVTVLSDDHVYVTMLEASPDSAAAQPNAAGKPPADLVIYPPRLDTSLETLTVGLRGDIFGKRDPDDLVYAAVSSLPRLGSYTALQTSYLLRAPHDRPFFLLGSETKTLVDQDGYTVSNELVKSFRIELPARTDDELLDLDLSRVQPLPATPIHVRVEPPAGGPFGAGTRPSADVESADSGLVVGLFGDSAPDADGSSFDIDVTVVATDVSPERLLSRATLLAPDGSRSELVDEGVMADGKVWTGFPLPPSIPDPDAQRTIHDPISLDGFPPGADLLVELYANNQQFWVLHGPPGGPRGKTFTIPYHDEITSARVGLVALSLSAQFDRVAPGRRGEIYRRKSTFRDVALAKQ